MLHLNALTLKLPSGITSHPTQSAGCRAAAAAAASAPSLSVDASIIDRKSIGSDTQSETDNGRPARARVLKLQCFGRGGVSCGFCSVSSAVVSLTVNQIFVL